MDSDFFSTSEFLTNNSQNAQHTYYSCLTPLILYPNGRGGYSFLR